MNLSTKVFLVLLQLSIGWHFLYEGAWKFQLANKWSSQGYLKAANGPTAPAARWLAGDPKVSREGSRFTTADPTVELQDYFAVKPIDKNLAPADRRLHQHVPPVLEKEWDAYFQAFLQAYHLDKVPAPTQADLQKVPPEFLAVFFANPTANSVAVFPWGPVQMNLVSQAWRYDADNPPEPRVQRFLAERRLLEMKEQLVSWLLSGTKKIKRPFMSGPAAEVSVAVPERLHEYMVADARAKALEASKATMFGHKATPELKKAREEANAIKTELLGDIKDQTNQMKLALRDILSPNQKRMSLPADPDAAKKPAWSTIKKVNDSVRWGLVVIGGLLIVGLFTRLAAIAGAVLVLSFYLAMPAFPWLPEPALSEGHYLFVNKNIIEMLALLAIATSHPARRYGLDMWIHMLICAVRGRKKKEATTENLPLITVKVPAEAPQPADPVLDIPEPSTRSDSSHAS